MAAGENLDRRNPGPSWGYALINSINRCLPWLCMRWILKLSSLVGLCLMKEQRGHARRFLRDVLKREPRWVDVWKNFNAFAELLVRRFDTAHGKEANFQPVGDADSRMWELAANKRPALYGTFHFGCSDLMGFWLSRFGITVRMVRYQVGNSSDLTWLENRFGDAVGFLWVNQPENLLFALKDAVEAGHSIAMKCDRVIHSSKREVFEFLGRKRYFPFTIYHLAILFDLPVLFAFGTPVGKLGVQVYTSQIYYPVGNSKAEKLEKARIHFRETLALFAGLLRRHPYEWFNFLDAIPVADEPPLDRKHHSV